MGICPHHMHRWVFSYTYVGGVSGVTAAGFPSVEVWRPEMGGIGEKEERVESGEI